MPAFTTTIKNMSSTIFNTDEKIKKYSGVLLSPILRKRPEATLYDMVQKIPAKMTFMYASAMTSISSGVLSQIRSCLDASTVGIVSTTETITVRMIAKAT